MMPDVLESGRVDLSFDARFRSDERLSRHIVEIVVGVFRGFGSWLS